MTIYIGIDVGLSGALCFMEETNITIAPIPIIMNTKKKSGKLYDIPTLNTILRAWSIRPCFATLETITGFGPGGLTAGISIGRGAGIIEALLAAHNIQYQAVHPKVWQKALFNSINKNDTKSASILVAKRLYPKINLIPEGCRKPSDGFSDALLLAEYGKRSYKTERR